MAASVNTFLKKDHFISISKSSIEIWVWICAWSADLHPIRLANVYGLSWITVVNCVLTYTGVRLPLFITIILHVLVNHSLPVRETDKQRGRDNSHNCIRSTLNLLLIFFFFFSFVQRETVFVIDPTTIFVSCLCLFSTYMLLRVFACFKWTIRADCHHWCVWVCSFALYFSFCGVLFSV